MHYAPRVHWKTTTLVEALRERGLTAPMVLDGAMNGKAFLAYVQQVLVPTLQPGDVVVLHNLSSHKSAGVRKAIEQTDAPLVYLRLQPRSQSHRIGVQQTPMAATIGRRTDSRCPVESHQQTARRRLGNEANIKVIEGAFTDSEKRQVIEKVTDALVAIEGESLRDKTVLIIEEPRSGDWGSAERR